MSEQRIGVGRVMRDRRMALGHTQTSLSRAMGDSISATWISRYESEDGEPQRLTIVRLADVLRLPKDDLLNAFWLATDAQRTDAIARLEGLVDVPDESEVRRVVGELWLAADSIDCTSSRRAPCSCRLCPRDREVGTRVNEVLRAFLSHIELTPERIAIPHPKPEYQWCIRE